ncbi:hypothetical protein QCD85_10025 [Paenibacillus sp. PsM32]|uniref:hypothetical protein n=1 Tax=unclassified Paenibacillus TaxID=185978 RepID=UPI002365AB28|nr:MULTISPECIES: hypothetical protein [unclassified Paenibacillus]MDN4618434.1 hypothetical protein [Paenibacillus sp. PsM32]WDF52929.1 hypothetical protein PQ460_11090 [Paenibacillus sp. KACC 21273]
MTNEISHSAQTKDVIVQLLSSDPEKEYNWKEIRAHVDNTLEIPITDGVFAGSVQTLNHYGKIKRVSRGMYALNIATPTKQDSNNLLIPNLLKILEEAESNIKKEVGKVTLLMLDDYNSDAIKLIQKLVKDQEKLRTEFEKKINELNGPSNKA